MIKALKEDLLCEELIWFSRRKPDVKSVVLGREGFFVTSQNWIIFLYKKKALIWANYFDIDHCFADDHRRFVFERNNYFFVFGNMQARYVSTYTDENLNNFYQQILKNNPEIRWRIGNFNSDHKKLATYVLFEIDQKSIDSKQRIYLKEKVKKLSFYKKNLTQPVIGNELIVLSNSLSISFKELFYKTVHQTIWSSQLFTDIGIFMIDLRGFPDIEGSIIYSKKPTKIVGVVIPGIFHKNNYREYLTFGYLFEKFSDQLLIAWEASFPIDKSNSRITAIYQQLKAGYDSTFKGKSKEAQTSSKNKIRVFGQTTVDLSPLDLDEDVEFLRFWHERIVKTIFVHNEKIPLIYGSHATGLVLNRRVVITNKHAVKEGYTGYIIFKDKLFKAQKCIIPKGSLDIAFIYLEENLTLLESIPKHELVETELDYEKPVYSIGYPLFKPESGFDSTPFVTKGFVLNFWKYVEFEKPMMILSSNLIFSGNSGGPVISSKGKLLSLTFANLKISEQNIIDEMSISVMFANWKALLAEIITDELYEKSINALEKLISADDYLSVKNSIIEDAASFFKQRKELLDLNLSEIEKKEKKI